MSVWVVTISVTRLGNLLDFGNFLKPFATFNLPKSPTFLDNVCKGVKSYYFSGEINFVQLFIYIWQFFSSHTGNHWHLKKLTPHWPSRLTLLTTLVMSPTTCQLRPMSSLFLLDANGVKSISMCLCVRGCLFFNLIQIVLKWFFWIELSN